MKSRAPTEVGPKFGSRRTSRRGRLLRARRTRLRTPRTECDSITVSICAKRPAISGCFAPSLRPPPNTSSPARIPPAADRPGHARRVEDLGDLRAADEPGSARCAPARASRSRRTGNARRRDATSSWIPSSRSTLTKWMPAVARSGSGQYSARRGERWRASRRGRRSPAAARRAHGDAGAHAAERRDGVRARRVRRRASASSIAAVRISTSHGAPARTSRASRRRRRTCRQRRAGRARRTRAAALRRRPSRRPRSARASSVIAASRRGDQPLRAPRVTGRAWRPRP